MTAASRPCVYVSGAVAGPVLAELKKHARVVVGYGPDAVAMEVALPEADGGLLRGEILTGDMIRRAPRLRVIARHGTGFDNVDVSVATENRIPVTVTPGVNASAVAEHVFALALAAARKITIFDQAIKRGDWYVRERWTGTELGGKRLGLVGFGAIGTAVARIARGFAMGVRVYDPNVRPEVVARGGATAVTFDNLLDSSDLLSVHVPLTPATYHLLGRQELRRLPLGAIVINTSRGGVIDEDALFEVLNNGHLGGAGLDVFENESAGMTNAIAAEGSGLASLPNVVMTPHIGGQTHEALQAVGAQAVQAIVEVFAGRRPGGLVNPEVYGTAESSKDGSARPRPAGSPGP